MGKIKQNSTRKTTHVNRHDCPALQLLLRHSCFLCCTSQQPVPRALQELKGGVHRASCSPSSRLASLLERQKAMCYFLLLPSSGMAVSGLWVSLWLDWVFPGKNFAFVFFILHIFFIWRLEGWSWVFQDGLMLHAQLWWVPVDCPKGYGYRF